MHLVSSRSGGHFLCSIISSRVDRKLFEISLQVRPRRRQRYHVVIYNIGYGRGVYTTLYTHAGYNQIVWKVGAKWLNNDRVMTGTNFKCLICDDDDDDDGKNGNRTMNPSVCVHRVGGAFKCPPICCECVLCVYRRFFGDKSRIQSRILLKEYYY